MCHILQQVVLQVRLCPPSRPRPVHESADHGLEQACLASAEASRFETPRLSPRTLISGSPLLLAAINITRCRLVSARFSTRIKSRRSFHITTRRRFKPAPFLGTVAARHLPSPPAPARVVQQSVLNMAIIAVAAAREGRKTLRRSGSTSCFAGSSRRGSRAGYTTMSAFRSTAALPYQPTTADQTQRMQRTSGCLAKRWRKRR